MMNHKLNQSKTCIDLYSGIGGWALGFKLCGVDIKQSFEWWSQASKTHDLNLLSNTTNCDIRELSHNNINGPVDFIVGSPPCTQFSYSNRGGSGNVEDGLKDIKKFLEIVNHFKPKYWAMENVPRVANVILVELSKGGSLEEFSSLCNSSMIKIYDFHEFGLPQKRKRCVVGNFNHVLLNSYKSKIKKKTLENVISSLSSTKVFDPNFLLTLSNNELTDKEKETSLNKEEERYNKESKTHHPVYNNMEFPDPLNKPVRTITATCTRVSRESVIIKENENYRRLSVRERASCQGFPISYQFHGNSHSSKLKMIGNAIPPVFTYYLANAMLEIPCKKLVTLEKVKINCIDKNQVPSHITSPDKEGKTYPLHRSFKFAIPNLRFKSGTRFELNNSKGKLPWKIEFFFGDSKRILSTKLDIKLFREINKEINTRNSLFSKEVKNIIAKKMKKIDHNKLQLIWSNKDKGLHPFDLLDDLGFLAHQLIQKSKNIDNDYFTGLIKKYVFVKSSSGKSISENKLTSYAREISIGLILGSAFNKIN